MTVKKKGILLKVLAYILLIVPTAVCVILSVVLTRVKEVNLNELEASSISGTEVTKYTLNHNSWIVIERYDGYYNILYNGNLAAADLTEAQANSYLDQHMYSREIDISTLLICLLILIPISIVCLIFIKKVPIGVTLIAIGLAALFISLIIIVFLGYLLKHEKIGFLKPEDVSYLNIIVVNITLPCLIFVNLISSATPSLFGELTILPIVALIAGTICAIIAYIILTVLKVDKKSKWSFLVAVTFGQSAFLGFPLVLGTYGQDQLVRAIFFDISSYIMFTALSVVLLMVFGEGLKKSIKKIITLPILWGIIFGIVFAIKGIQIGDILFNTLNFLGQATIPLSMLILGLSLDFTSLIKNYKISSIMAFLKIIIFPTICAIFILLLHATGYNFLNYHISVIEAIVPCGLLTLVLSINYNLNSKITSDTVFLSTLISFITIPIMLVILNNPHILTL